MIEIDDILISDEVVERRFLCDLSRCKGACCVEGDGGAPLEQEELDLLDRYAAEIREHLGPAGIDTIEKKGRYCFEKDDEYTGHATPLNDSDGACAYTVYDDSGIASCGIERAWQAGAVPFRKPVSCHLYPVRVKEYKKLTAVNYETWDICAPACRLGSAMQLPLYAFVKEALIRKFGEDFYEQLDAAAAHLQKSNDQ